MLTRRREHADALNAEGLRVSGRSDFTATVTASDDPGDLEPADLGDRGDEGARPRAGRRGAGGPLPERHGDDRC